MYQLFDSETIEAWKQFDITSKKFVAQCYREGLQRNGKSVKELYEVQADSDTINAMRK